MGADKQTAVVRTINQFNGWQRQGRGDAVDRGGLLENLDRRVRLAGRYEKLFRVAGPYACHHIIQQGLRFGLGKFGVIHEQFLLYVLERDHAARTS